VSAAGGDLLRVEGLRRSFAGFTALAGVDLAVAPGEIRSVIGPNGAGKSTLFNVITGLYRPTAGRILFEGRNISGLAPARIVRAGIARAFQIVNLFPGLPALENVRLACQARDLRSRRADLVRRAEAILEQVGLSGRAGAPARELSHGEQRCLEIGIALGTAPRLLLLDEPMAGLTPAETRTISDLVLALDRRCTVLLIEHDLDVVMRLSTRITVLHQGEVLAEGTPPEIRENTAVRRTYLGGAL
jgi:branched-chain amino acid transport system ATP-binding protein